MTSDPESWKPHEPSERRATPFRPRFSPHFASAAELKANLPAYLFVKGCAPEISTATDELRARCPFCQTAAPTLTGTLQLDVWRWECTECQRRGTIIDMYAALHGMEPRGADFLEVVRKLNIELRGHEILYAGTAKRGQEGNAGGSRR